MSKPTINHDLGCLPASNQKTIDALAAGNYGFARWADGLYVIRVLEKEQDGPIKRAKGSIVLVPASPQLIMELATDAAVHRKWDLRSNDYRVINCPQIVANGILARGYWPEFPLLTGIVEAATLDLDGREISTPGHDAKSGLYVATAAQLKPLKGKAGRARGTESIKVLLKLMRGFPFVSDADSSAALAAVMTSLLRRLLPAAPMFGITAPTPGTGKTMLAEAVSIIATGRRPAVMSLGSDENEFAKRLNGVLLAGDSMLGIDNITRPIGNEDVLNQLLSQPVLRFRPLGGSGMVSAPTNILVMTTGNNLAVVGDAKRRTVLIRLDAREERPEQRVFDWDVLSEAQAQRDALIRAALEISKSYIEIGCPAVDAKPYGSFSDWDKMVRRPLIWLGQPDPIQTADELREQDPDIETMRAMFAAWREIYSDQVVTAPKVVKDGLEYGLAQHVYPDLHDALQLACMGKIDARRLGNWLRFHKNRIIDGFQLMQHSYDGHLRQSRWKVVAI